MSNKDDFPFEGEGIPGYDPVADKKLHEVADAIAAQARTHQARLAMMLTNTRDSTYNTTNTEAAGTDRQGRRPITTNTGPKHARAPRYHGRHVA